MGKENNTKQYDNINKALFIGQKVKHISFGEGTIADIKDGFIFVDFYNKPMRQFDFPSVFSSYLAPVSDYITNFVKELYGNHTCLRCGVAIINGSKKTICDRCKSKLKICPICKNKAFVKSVDEVNRYRSRYEEEYLICSNCFNKYYNKEETTNDKNVDSENSEGRTYLETNRANKINKNDQYITVYAISCHCLSCERNNHFPRMIPYSIEVESMRKRVLDLPVERCNICGRFYINEVVIEKFEKDYGRLLIERKYEKGCKKPKNSSGYGYADDTILSRCGYSAQIDNNSIRMRILQYILLSGKATKDEVMEILSSFITNRGDRCYMAKPKWEYDLKYVSQIDLDKCPKIHDFVFKMTDRSNQRTKWSIQ